MNTPIFVIDAQDELINLMKNQLEDFSNSVQWFRSGEEFLAFWESTPTAGIAVVELKLEDMSGATLQNRIQLIGRPLPLIFASAKACVHEVVQVIKNGAVDFLERPLQAAVLRRALEEAETRLQQEEARYQTRNTCGLMFTRLTRREREVFELVANGLLNKQIAIRLGIAEKTVKIHRSRVMRKLNVANVADLVRFYVRLNPASVHEVEVTTES